MFTSITSSGRQVGRAAGGETKQNQVPVAGTEVERTGSGWVDDSRLIRFGWTCIALAVPAGLLVLVDEREVSGVNTWIKPIKFLLSTGVYVLTIAWVVRYLSLEQRRGRAARYIETATVGASILEMVLIVGRAALA
jgi:hypothetical protein